MSMPMRTGRSLVALALVSVLVACGGRNSEKLVESSFRLPNGLQVDLVAGPCGDTAALVVLFQVGTDHDPPGRSGLAHLVERLLSMSMPAGPERIIEAGADHTVYAAVVAGDRLLDQIDDVAARMARLQLTEVELVQARAQVIEQLTRRRGGDAALTAMSYAAEAVQPTRGNGWRGGVAAEVEAINLTEVEASWQAHFKPGNARVIVVGRFDPKQVRARVETAFAALPAGTPPVLRPPADASVTGTLVMGDAPRAVAIAVPAPSPSAPVYPAFLILAARLMGETSPARTWEVSYDPLTRPETLFITGPVQANEQPEPAAARIRAEIATLLAPSLAPGDIDATKQRFGLFLGVHAREPAACKNDPRGFAIARARRAQLGLDRVLVTKALEATTQVQLDEAATHFDPKRTAAVIAGGTIR